MKLTLAMFRARMSGPRPVGLEEAGIRSGGLGLRLVGANEANVSNVRSGGSGLHSIGHIIKPTLVSNADQGLAIALVMFSHGFRVVFSRCK